MDDFIIVIKKDPKEKKTKDILEKNNRLPYKYPSEIGHDTSVQNLVLKEILSPMGVTIIDIDIKTKMKISRIDYLES